MPTSTAVILDGTTDGSGIIQDTGFSYTSDQPVTGRARLSTTTGSLYVSTPINGTIRSGGFNFTALLPSDE